MVSAGSLCLCRGRYPCQTEHLRGLLQHVRPTCQIDADFLSMIVACIGTSLSAYIYTWQSNQEVEEQIAEGRRKLSQRKGASDRELEKIRQDVLVGMIFS